MSKKYLTEEEELEYFNSEKFKQDVKDIRNKSNSKLADLCMIHRYLYYVLCEPIISDVEYDLMEKKALLTCAETHPIRKPGSDLKSSYSSEIVRQANELLNGK